MKMKLITGHLLRGAKWHKPVIICNGLSALGCGLLVACMYSCGGGGKNNSAGMSRQSCMDSVKSIEAKLINTMTPDVATYSRAMTTYLRFADNFPQDSMAAPYLFNAAGIAMSLNQYQRAINLYDTITVKYPSFRRVPDCIFITGYIYDDKIKDTAKAHAFYQEVINKYPNSNYASQARAAIAILGKSYDEIMKQFEEKNKKK